MRIDKSCARETVWIKGVEALKETPKALLCLTPTKEVWIPKSQITEDSEVLAEGDVGTLVITEWIAGEKGLK